MRWSQLLSKARLRQRASEPPIGRNEYQQDRDRIVFSYAFRRLADKTQVHPLSANDHVRTRLTHSIEVASVGRSLGYLVGQTIVSQHGLESRDLAADQFGYIVEAACLAHDLGNPPFGHSGEAAISKWFKESRLADELMSDFTEQEKQDFLKFEGNAQGFRIITSLENHPSNGGLQLTHAVLGAFTKYPCASCFSDSVKYIGTKKNGFFSAEHPYFAEIAEETGLLPRSDSRLAWCRHPLAFLTEAADDICYTIADLEDGHEVGRVSIHEVERLLRPVAEASQDDIRSLTPKQKVGKLRALAISNLVKESSAIFLDHEDDILDGSFGERLLDHSRYKLALEEIASITRERVFSSDLVIPVEIAGFQIIAGLLDCFGSLVSELRNCEFVSEKLDKRSRSRKLVQHSGLDFDASDTTYTALLKVTDYVAGMTDSYAVEQYQLLSGIRYR
jgi:dGTPase